MLYKNENQFSARWQKSMHHRARQQAFVEA